MPKLAGMALVALLGDVPTPGVPEPTRLLQTTHGFSPSEVTRHSDRYERVTFTPGLQVRGRMGGVSRFSMDAEGSRYEEGLELGGRIRWSPQLDIRLLGETLSLFGQVDAARGRWFPAAPANDVTLDIIEDGRPPTWTRLRITELRELHLRWDTEAWSLVAGQVAFQWGLGLWANDGDHVDRFGDLRFGDDGFGTIVERVLIEGRPWRRSPGRARGISLGFGADVILRDPEVELGGGDRAGSALMTLRYSRPEDPDSWLGLYASYRIQRSGRTANLDLIERGVFDLAGQGHRPLGPNLTALGAFEVVGTVGRATTRQGEFESVDLRSAAAAVRGYIGKPATWLAGLDAGWATGDEDVTDDRVTGFVAAAGHRVGLVMFPYYIGWQRARSERLMDGGTVAVNALPTGGGLTDALYFHPKARYALAGRFELWGDRWSRSPRAESSIRTRRPRRPTDSRGTAAEAIPIASTWERSSMPVYVRVSWSEACGCKRGSKVGCTSPAGRSPDPTSIAMAPWRRVGCVWSCGTESPKPVQILLEPLPCRSTPRS